MDDEAKARHKAEQAAGRAKHRERLSVRAERDEMNAERAAEIFAKARKNRRSSIGFWVLLLLVVGAVGGVGAVLRSHQVSNGGGDPRSALIVPSATGGALFLIDKQRGSGAASWIRLSSVDLVTGERTAVRKLGVHSCWPASPGRAWCDLADGYVLLDARTLASIGESGALLGKSGLGRPVPRRMRSDGADLHLLLDDGRVAKVDSTTLAVSPSEVAAGTLDGERPPAPHRCQGERRITVAGAALSFGNGPRASLLRDGSAFGSPAATFLDPSFVTVAGSDATLVLHATSLDPARTQPELSRIAADGRVAWKVDAGGRCQLAQVIGGLLVFASDGNRPRATGIDPATGALRWQLRYDD